MMQREIDIINNNHQPASSLSSSGISSTPLSCVVPSDNLDFHQSSVSTNSRTFRKPLASAASAAVPSSNQSMGQNQSTVAVASSAGHKFKRAFSRRKKSEDVTREADYQDSPPPSPSPVTRFFGYRKASLTSTSSPSSIPPPLPSGPLPPQAEVKSLQPSIDYSSKPVTSDRSGASTSAQVTRQEEDGSMPAEHRHTRLGQEDHAAEEVKEDWRKSDATMASLNTIRPDADTSQGARPLSLAESSHSTNTIVAVNKRISVLAAELELQSPGDKEAELLGGRSQSPTSSLQSQHRRSVSLKFETAIPTELHTTPPDGLPHTLPSRPEEPLPVSERPALTKTAAEGFISPPHSNTDSSQPPGSQVRGRLAAWTRAPLQPPGSFKAPPSFRQTAVSISGSIAPAAMDLGKRAMERMGRAWGSRGAGSPLRHDGFSPSEQSSKHRAADSTVGLHPNDSVPSQISSLPTPGKGKRRRTPNAPSGSWSIASSATSSVSISDVEPCPALAAINGSTCLRGPLSSGGLVFGRKLSDCVRETAIDEIRLQLISGEYFDKEARDSLDEDAPLMRPLEQRLLPAVVVRCVQHLLIWGVQEEGLFRMNGRSAHIRALRGEFDQGADYDISKCAPYDIDPHVVSSLFKLYLREMPEPLLTSELLPYFDAIMNSESGTDSTTVQNSLASTAGSGSGMAIRKPPSLSTLAMPNLAGMRSVSPSLLQGITALIAKLPKENRDLLYTVTELMRTTASRSKETKMPLANLLLVFCPSLNMKPSLLRILCTSDDVWSLRPDAADSPTPDVTLSNQPSVSSGESSPIDDASHLEDSSLERPVGVRRGLRRGPVATLYRNVTPNSSLTVSSDSQSYTDDASDLSLPEASHKENRVVYNVSPPLSSSVESLATPSTSSEVPPFEFPPTKDDSFTTPVIADYTQLSLCSSPRPLISSPVPFPTSAPSLSTSLLSSRNLSMPALDSGSGSPRISRRSRPSLHLLFSKKSVSSLRSVSSTISSPLPYPNPPPPTDARTLSLPVLDTPINSSPILIHFEEKDFVPASSLKIAPVLTQSQSTSSTTTDSPASALYATPSSGSRLSFNITGDNTADDWMKSVLKAVDINDNELPVSDQVKSIPLH